MIFLAVNIIDRFFSCCQVQANRFQLVGITALNMAHKFKNGVQEKLPYLSCLCNNACTADQITRAERYILRILDYRLAWPGPLPFLERINKASQVPSLTKIIAEYILEATVTTSTHALELPSLIAASAFLLAQSLMGNYNWVRQNQRLYSHGTDNGQTYEQERCSGYHSSQLHPHVEALLSWMRDSRALYQSVYYKYARLERGRVAIVVAETLERVKHSATLHYLYN
jgi:G2/mitotic-specific cyclin 3/4